MWISLTSDGRAVSSSFDGFELDNVMTTLVPLGKLGKPHGLKGEVRFWPFNPESDSLEPGVTLSCELNGEVTPLVIESIRWRERFALLAFEGLLHKDEVAAFVNAECFIDRSLLPEIDEDEFYLIDLIDLPVFGRMTEEEEHREIGRVKEFMETGANDVIRVTLGIGGDLLVPFVMDYAVEDVVMDEGIYLMPLDGWAIEGTEV